MAGSTGGNAIARGIGAALALAVAPVAAQDTPPDLKAARAGMAGEWRAELQYRDYQSGEWIGIPYTATIVLAGDGVTLVRTSAFDDGPARGIVYITSVSMLLQDGTTETTGTFRADRTPELDSAALTLTAAADARRWTIVSTRQSRDDDRPAAIRETTVRDGDMVTSTKEVDFTDDDKAEWLVRNRTVMTRTAG